MPNRLKRLQSCIIGTMIGVITICMVPKAWGDNPPMQDSGAQINGRTVTVKGSTGGTTTTQAPKSSTGNKASTTSTQNPCLNLTPGQMLCLAPRRQPAKPAGPNIGQVGAEAAASVTMPVNAPVFGPQPSQNKWGIIPVGYPIWLWSSDGQTAITQSVTDQGLTVTVTATRQSINFDMGDGGHVTCANFTVRPEHNDPFQASPTCGYTYMATGNFTVTATTTWLVTWQVSGQAGSLTVTDTAQAPAPLPVGELHTVIVTDPPK